MRLTLARMAQPVKMFSTVLLIPKLWQSLLAIESFDDLSLFLQKQAPREALELDGTTRPDWPRPIVNDRRKVSFIQDEHTVALELLSGNDHYFVRASVVLPSGEMYAHTEISYNIAAEEILEVQGLGKFVWRQELV
jgi:hypothetical protein